MNNIAAVMTGIRKFEFQEIPMPKVGKGEVGITVKDIGICGSDMHFFNGDAMKIFPNSLPFILGHEIGGYIYEVGEDVSNFAVGDKVALEPGVPCCKCEMCQSGRYNLCKDVVFLATPPYNGGMQRYISYPAFKTYKLPDNLSTLEGAMMEPLSVGLHAVRRGEVKLGDSIAILGGGCIGMMTLLAAKAHGAARIIVTDVANSHLDKALELGATDVINSKDSDPVEMINQLTGGIGVDVVFETAGIPATAAQTSYIVKWGGTIVMVGNILPEVSYSFRNIYRKEAQIKGVFRYHSTYPIAIQAVSTGKINVKSIVTGVCDFMDSHAAFVNSLDNKDHCIKNVIHIND